MVSCKIAKKKYMFSAPSKKKVSFIRVSAMKQIPGLLNF